MRGNRALQGLTMLGAVLFALSAGSAARTSGLTAPAVLGTVQAGLWQVKVDGEATQNICVANPAALTQVRHGQSACTRMVIDSDVRSATVHYSCPGAGWGRTSIRVSSPALVRIDTQGIADNAPFAFKAEARRTGDCGGATRVSARP